MCRIEAAAVVMGLFICCGGCDRGPTDTERAAAYAAAQKAYAEKAERERLEMRDAGVLTTPPAWAKDVAPPPVEVDNVKEVLDVRELLVRYRLPPGNTEECLEYYVEGVAKRTMRFSKKDADGNVWIPAGEGDRILEGGFVIRFIGHDGRPVLPDQVITFDGETVREGSGLSFVARLKPDQLKDVRSVRFEAYGSNADSPPANVEPIRRAVPQQGT